MRIIFLFITTIALTSCITLGRNFKTVDGSILALGKTTKTEALSYLGSPSAEVDSETPFTDKDMIQFDYSYVTDGMSKAQSLYFYDDILVGYEFSSNFPDKNTFYDHKKVNEISVNETTRQQILAIFGNPDGKHISPMVPENASYNEVYAYNKVTPGRVMYTFNIVSLYLVISYDENDTVVDVFQRNKIVDN